MNHRGPPKGESENNINTSPEFPLFRESFRMDLSLNSCVQSTETVQHLFAKYRDDPYMVAKVHNYVCFQLPNIMENIRRTREERQQRIAELTTEQEGFIERFLATHHYFYVPATENFVFYDGQHYSLALEDSILHHILTTITSEEKRLMIWKQRTKVYLMKRIKDQLLVKTIPESYTIQHVLECLHPTLFETKQEAKYFLTIIGDNLLRKHGDLIHFIPGKAKTFLRELANVSQVLFGGNAMGTFKHKYHDQHEYAQCRVVNCNDSVANEHIWGRILRNASVDMLCVACHYSTRYGSSDEYVAKYSHSETLEQSIFYLRNHSQSQLVELFIAEYLQVTILPPLEWTDDPPSRPSSRQISWKNMQYLWRHFLQSLRLPTIMFQQDLKQQLVDNMPGNYRETTDSFIEVSSRFMPAIRSFMRFWEQTMVIDETGEYEIDELCTLYTKWGAGTSAGGGLNESQMLDLVAYYFPYVEIEKEKYVYGVRCILWDKSLDIQTALEIQKETLRERARATDEPHSPYSTTLYDAYLEYCKYVKHRGEWTPASETERGESCPIVSKSFFEKYVREHFGRYIFEENYLAYSWLFS